MGNQFAVAERAAPSVTVRARAADQATAAKRAARIRSPRPVPPGIQPKLLIGPADDPFEREADRTADAVMGQTPTLARRFGAASAARSLLRYAQRAIGKAEPPTKKDDDEKNKHLQKMPSGRGGPEVVPTGIESGITSMASGG